MLPPEPHLLQTLLNYWLHTYSLTSFLSFFDLERVFCADMCIFTVLCISILLLLTCNSIFYMPLFKTKMRFTYSACSKSRNMQVQNSFKISTCVWCLEYRNNFYFNFFMLFSITLLLVWAIEAEKISKQNARKIRMCFKVNTNVQAEMS